MEVGKVDADELWNVAWTYIKTVVDTLREPFLILDENLSVLSANRTFYITFQVTAKETDLEKISQCGGRHGGNFLYGRSDQDEILQI